ncbi:MAG: hypothetical protein E6R07_14120 [Nevskiaceae bacterium]|nr:MAG: hypothetical protein E6R07_14120 [Nevskiaceae bacterium]
MSRATPLSAAARRFFAQVLGMAALAAAVLMRLPAFGVAYADDDPQTVEITAGVMGAVAVLLALIGLLPRRWALGLALLYGLIGG